MIALLLVAAQAAPAVPDRFSILVPVADQPCRTRRDGDDIVVCADPLPAQALPLPGEVAPRGPLPANRDLSARTALALETPPCAATAAGCRGAVALPLIPLVKGAAGRVAGAFARTPDRSGRVPIDLADPAPKVLP